MSVLTGAALLWDKVSAYRIQRGQQRSQETEQERKGHADDFARVLVVVDRLEGEVKICNEDRAALRSELGQLRNEHKDDSDKATKELLRLKDKCHRLEWDNRNLKENMTACNLQSGLARDEAHEALGQVRKDRRTDVYPEQGNGDDT